MIPLAPVPQPQDLPPRWDGEPVTWTPWADHRTTLALHAKPEQLACHKCGTVDESLVCFGTRPPPPGDMETVPLRRHTRSGHPYESLRQVPARPVRDLTAYRCRHCSHDQVQDRRTGELWDLGPEDYGPQGSTPIDTLF